mgnify:CR=1 FL=1
MDALSYEIYALSPENKDTFQRFFRQKRFDIVLNTVLSLDVRKPKLLELGCGIGAHSLELARKGFDVTGIDINRNFIKYAKKEAEKKAIKNIKFLQMDITKPINLGKYDIILTSEVIEHIINFRDVFENIEKSLKPSGYLVLTVPNHAGIGGFTEFLWAMKARFNWVDEHYGYCCNTRRIQNLLKEYGIEPLKTYTIFYVSQFLPFISSRLAEFVFDKEIRYFSWLNFGAVIVNISKKVDK